MSPRPPDPPAVVSTPGQVPLLVRAHLAGSVAHAAPWGVALDGLLAASCGRRRRPPRSPQDTPRNPWPTLPTRRT